MFFFLHFFFVQYSTEDIEKEKIKRTSYTMAFMIIKNENEQRNEQPRFRKSKKK